MGKKDKKNIKKGGNSPPDPVKSPILSKRGWKVVYGGLGTVTLGFIVLCFTDPHGQNFASTLSPFLVIAGYALIAIGIITKDPAA